MAEEEKDEFGIPIRKKATPQPSSERDEFGILKKKVPSQPVSQTGSVTSGGTSVIGSSNPLNPATVRFPNNFNFAQQQDPETYNKVQAEKQQAKQRQSNRLTEIQGVYDQAQGAGASQAIQQIAQNRPQDTLTDPATEPYSGIGNNVAVGLNKAYEGLLKVPRFIYSAAAVPQNFLADQLDIPGLATKYENFLEVTNSPTVTSPLTMLDQLGDYYGEQAEGYAAKTQKYDDTITGSLNKGNFKQAGSQILDQIAESAPSIAIMAMTSGAGNTAGLSQTSKTLANALPFMSQRNAELQDDGSVPEWLKPVNAAANGLAEVVFDQSFGTQAAIQGIVNRFQNEGREAAVNAAKELTGSFLNGALKTVNAIKPFAKGAIEEASTQLAQNIVDKYTINPDKDLMEGVADAAIVGSAMTGGITTAGNIALPTQRTQVRELETQQQALLNELGNENLSPASREAVGKVIEGNQVTIENIAKEAEETVAKLNPAQKKQVEALNEQAVAAEAILSDPNASEEVKKVAEQQIQTISKEIDAIKPEEGTKEAIQETKIPKPTETTTEVKEAVVEPAKESVEKDTFLHGSPQSGLTKFDSEYSGGNTNVESAKGGIWVTNNQSVAETYRDWKNPMDKGKTGDVYDVNVDIRNPLYTEDTNEVGRNKAIEQAKENGNDSVVFTDNDGNKQIFIFNPEQATIANKPAATTEKVVAEDLSQKRNEEVLAKAEDDLKALKQVTDKVKKYDASMKRITEAKNNKEITTAEFNDLKKRFDDVIGESTPKVKEEATNAVSIESTESVDVRQPSQDGKGVEQGNTEGQETARTQEVVRPEEVPVDTKKEEEKATALKNRDIAKKRKELGFEPRDRVSPISNPELVKQANQKIKDGYDTDALIDDVLDGRREAKNDEVVILKEYQLAKEQQLIDVGDKIVTATEEGKGTTLDKLIQERDDILNDIDRAYRAGERTGTVSARALQARKIALINDYSLANMLIEKRTANSGQKLSTEQIDATMAEYNKIRKLNEELQKKIDTLTAENTDIKSNKAMKGLKNLVEYEDRKMGRVEQRASIDKDIADTVESLSKKIKAQAGKLSMNAIPVELIPDIAKLAKLYTKKGINTIEGIVDAVYTNLKNDIDGLTKEEIQDILINYDYDADAKQESRLKAFKNRTAKRINEIRGRVDSKDFARRKIEPIKLDKEGLDLQDELRKAKHDWDKALETDRLNSRTTLEKIRDGATEVFNLPRALMASLDYSAPLRQGLVLGVNNPRVAGRAFVEMFRQSWSQKRFDRWIDDLKESPEYPVMKDAGLYIADSHNPKLAAKEEQFMSNLADKIPGIGKIIKGSERAYVSYLNKLRTDVFAKTAEQFENEGKTIENSPKLYEALATYINSATGRGDLGKLENSAQILNSTFFSPRLIASRVRLLTNWANPVWYANTPKEVRYMYAKDMLRLIAVGTTLLGLASAAGADVEDDPRSSDFGKIRIGEKRWDIWGGFQQFVRFFTQLATAQRKSTSDKTIREIDGKGFRGESRADLVLNMMRSKLSPVPATAWNLAEGENMVGEEYTWKDVPQSFLPLFFADLAKATSKDGVEGLLGTGVPGIFGVGVQDYSKKDAKIPKTKEERDAAIKKALDELKKNTNKNN